MSTENFKQQQQDRIDEGKELKHEDQLKDLSQIPSKQLPGAENKSLLSKITQGISNVANTISEKVGLSEPVVKGHEDLDKDVRRQVKKVNQEIRKRSADKGTEAEIIQGHEDLDKDVRKQVKKVNQEIRKRSADKGTDAEKPSDWEKTLEKHVKNADLDEGVKTQVKKVNQEIIKRGPNTTSVAGKIKDGVSGISQSISQGVDNVRGRFAGKKEEERNDDGTKSFKTVKDGFNEKVDDLKHEKRVEALGGQEELASKNPFQPLTSGNNDQEGENRALGEKIRGGLNDASQKISSTVGGVTQKVKSAFVHKEATAQDKENAQQTA